MSADEGGILGNLPRSRPGTRSEKRTAGQAARGRQEPARASSRRKPARRSEPPAEPADPVGDAVRTAARVAGAGLRVANGLTRELLRRVPRP